MLISPEKNKILLKGLILTGSLFSIVLPADSTCATVSADKNDFSIKGANNFELQLKGYGQMTGYFGVADEKNIYGLILDPARQAGHTSKIRYKRTGAYSCRVCVFTTNSGCLLTA